MKDRVAVKIIEEVACVFSRRVFTFSFLNREIRSSKS